MNHVLGTRRTSPATNKTDTRETTEDLGKGTKTNIDLLFPQDTRNAGQVGEQNWLQNAHHAKGHETAKCQEISWRTELVAVFHAKRHDTGMTLLTKTVSVTTDPKVLSCRKEIKNKGVVKNARTTTTQSLSTVF